MATYQGGHGTFTSKSGGWSFTGTLAGGRPVAGVLTEPGGRRFDVKYAGDCALMQHNPTPSSKVAQPQVLGDLQPPFLPALCKNSRTAQECTHNMPKNNALNRAHRMHREASPTTAGVLTISYQ